MTQFVFPGWSQDSFLRWLEEKGMKTQEGKEEERTPRHTASSGKTPSWGLSTHDLECSCSGLATGWLDTPSPALGQTCCIPTKRQTWGSEPLPLSWELCQLTVDGWLHSGIYLDQEWETHLAEITSCQQPTWSIVVKPVGAGETDSPPCPTWYAYRYAHLCLGLSWGWKVAEVTV